MTEEDKHDGGLELSGRNVSDDDMVQNVIKAKAKAAEQSRVIKSLTKDRDQLLDEYTDMRDARPVPKQRKRSGGKRPETIVRVSVGDVHGMMMDKAAVAVFLEDVKMLCPDEIVLGGDIAECGGWLAKHQPMGYVALCDYSYQEDCKAANWFLDEVQKAAPSAEMHYIEGNHEDRVERWCVDQTMAHKRDAEFLRKAFAPEYMLRLAERGISYYRRSVIYGDGYPRGWIKLGSMFFTHELGASKNAARDAIMKTAGNVTYFHTHREDSATVVFPEVGIVKAFNPGCLCSMQPVWKRSDPTTWSQGYQIEFVAKQGNFQCVHVPIWRGGSLAGAMCEKFKS